MPSRSGVGVHPKNSFGALRLLFASLVIVSHTPELLDGNRHRELLTSAFGTLSFGELSVDAFFLISGYLITSSFLASTGLGSYFLKRVLRIYPGFIVCSALCVFVLAPYVGGQLSGLAVWAALANMLTLTPPDVRGAFSSLHYPVLDGALWTIRYEFGCYLAAAAIGSLGFFTKRIWLLALTALMLVASVLIRLDHQGFLGEAKPAIRFLALFLCGSTYRVWRDRVKWDGTWACFALSATLGLLFCRQLAEVGLATFGAYALFWFATRIPCRVNAQEDISYGVYLYAWPITSILIWCWPRIGVLDLGVLTMLGAVVCGLFSWFLVEKPVQTLAKTPRSGLIAVAQKSASSS